MHTPDGFVTGWICVLMLLLSGAALLIAFRRRHEWLTRANAPRMALAASLIFLLQMLNFPVADGTSGHFLGSALALILLGPYAAFAVMSGVLLIQALVFGDGGLFALGVNIFNMSIIGVLAADFALGRLPKAYGNAASSLASVVASSLSASLLLFLSGQGAAVFPPMLGVHMFIGLGEALITLAIVPLFHKAGSPSGDISWGRTLGYLSCALLLAYFALPFASADPDGLERVAIDLGFYSSQTTLFAAPVPDYSFPGMGGTAAVFAAAVLGCLACLPVPVVASRLAS